MRKYYVKNGIVVAGTDSGTERKVIDELFLKRKNKSYKPSKRKKV